jgi:hypothetical protein
LGPGLLALAHRLLLGRARELGLEQAMVALALALAPLLELLAL